MTINFNLHWKSNDQIGPHVFLSKEEETCIRKKRNGRKRRRKGKGKGKGKEKEKEKEKERERERDKKDKS